MTLTTSQGFDAAKSHRRRLRRTDHITSRGLFGCSRDSFDEGPFVVVAPHKKRKEKKTCKFDLDDEF
jgi:hypothetical protein